MIALDTSFLVDYLDGEPVAGEFVEEHREQPLHAPAQALFEVYRGGAHSSPDDRREGIERVEDALAWVQPLAFDRAGAGTAARVEADLLETGERINLGDVVVAGTCLQHGADLVTADGHFERIDGLDVVRYDRR